MIAKWINDLPWLVLLPFTLLAIAPFGATPHLVEKCRMLFSGTLRRPLDWFDLVLHAAPIALILLKLVFMLRRTSPH